MPPKSKPEIPKAKPTASARQPNSQSRRDRNHEEPKEEASSDEEIKPKSKPSTNPRKRKQPAKEPKQGSRKSARCNPPKAQPSRPQLLHYLLTKDCQTLCRPADEIKALAAHKHSNSNLNTNTKQQQASNKPSQLKTYTSPAMNPFQELVSAIVLSRPISHTLGLRTIRTLFNPPYSLTSSRAMSEAGGETLHQALWDARTQHKAKTADQLFALADVVLEMDTENEASGGGGEDECKDGDEGKDKDENGEMLGKVLGRSDVDAALGQLAKSVNGLGPMGCDIFRRRVQWLWPAAFPFVDERSGKGLEGLGLPSGAEELERVVEENWTDRMAMMDDDDGVGDGDSSSGGGGLEGKNEAERKRRAFVVILERATSAVLEGKIDDVLSMAAKAR